MSSVKRGLADFIQHILIGIEKIERHTRNLDQSGFLKNDLVQDAVLRNLEVIGEASNNILKSYPEFSSAHPEIQFSAAYQMRNAVSHGYFAVDLQVVWRTVEKSIPVLKAQLLRAKVGPDA